MNRGQASQQIYYSLRLRVLHPRGEIGADVFVHLALVGIPTPHSIGIERDIPEGIELEAPKFGPTFVIASVLYLAMP